MRETTQYNFLNMDENEMTLWILLWQMTYIYSELWKHKIKHDFMKINKILRRLFY
jgi:hypothetical protein